MKSGASDPLADDDPQDEAAEAGGTAVSDPEPVGERPQTERSVTPSSNTGTIDRSELPYYLRRDRVKDERDEVHQLFVLDETDDMETDARRDLEDRFGEDVYKTDAREAFYRAGMRNLDDAEQQLREWGQE